MKVSQLIETLGLIAHPEGGYYKETFRSEGVLAHSSLPQRFLGDRNFMTNIYYLLEKGDFSAFHQINQEETWHFYAGSPLRIHMIDQAGVYSDVVVGNNLLEGERPQFTVLSNVWFAVEPLGEWFLAGCTVAPGFDFRDFEMADRKDLTKRYPQHAGVIEKYTRLS